MIVLALDPGKSTGVAVLDYPEEEKPNPLSMANPNEMLKLSTEKHLWYGINELLEEYNPDIVVYESFRLYKHKSKQKINSEMPTSKVIGVIAYLTELCGIPNYRQSANLGKGFYDDKKLKMMDLYDLGSPHKRDSLRHALHYVTFNLGKEDPQYKDRDLAY